MTNRELDAAIAEALGNPHWVRAEPQPQHAEWYGDCDGYGPDGECSVCTGIIACDLPAYSTDPVAADALMRALRERGWGFGIDCEPDGETQVCITKGYVFLADETDDTWPLALAKAAHAALTAGKP